MKFTKVAPYLQSVLRMVAAFLFLTHGSQKLLAYPAGPRAAFASMLGLAGILELGGGMLLLIGLFTRPTALVLCAEMAYAYATVHYPRGPWPLLNAGEPAVLYCFLWLFFSAAGAGPISIDRVLRRA